MTLFTIVLLLAALPLVGNASDDKPDDDEPAVQTRTQAYVPLALRSAAPFRSDAFVSSSDYFNAQDRVTPDRLPSWQIAPTSSRLRVWTDFAYGIVEEEFDAEGDRVDVGSDIRFGGVQFSLADAAGALGVQLPDGTSGTVVTEGRIIGTLPATNFHVGGAYTVLRRPSFELEFGANLGFVQQNFEADEVHVNLEDAVAQNVTVSLPPEIGGGTITYNQISLQNLVALLNPSLTVPAQTTIESNRTVESGFKAQNLTLFTEVRNDWLSGRLAFLLDLGPEPDLVNNERENSDRQHAFLLGLSASQRFFDDRIRAFGAADAILTLSSEEGGINYDEGDHLGARGGLGYNFGFAELGAALTFRYRTSGTEPVFFGTSAYSEPTQPRYHVGVAPYLNVTPPNVPVLVYVKGGVKDEYLDFTYSLVGENEFAPQLGFTVGVEYRM